MTVRPPRFRVSVNDPSLITRDYGYWFENQLRDRFELEGVPGVDHPHSAEPGNPESHRS